MMEVKALGDGFSSGQFRKFVCRWQKRGLGCLARNVVILRIPFRLPEPLLPLFDFFSAAAHLPTLKLTLRIFPYGLPGCEGQGAPMIACLNPSPHARQLSPPHCSQREKWLVVPSKRWA